MKRSMQRVANRERKRRTQKEERSRWNTSTTQRDYTAAAVLPVAATTTMTIDDCLAEMESSLLLPLPSNRNGQEEEGGCSQPETGNSNKKTSEDHNDGSSSALPFLPRPQCQEEEDLNSPPQRRRRQLQHCTINSSAIREKVEIWNQTFQAWQVSSSSKGSTSKKKPQRHQQHQQQPPPAQLLPNFDVELARHFKLQELSTFLLEASLVTDGPGRPPAAGLKMPAFERWLLDAKLQDHYKWRAMSNNNSILLLHDPVLPKDAHIGLEASKRLLEELVESTGMVRLNAHNLVKDLCRRSNTAYQTIQQLQRALATRSGVWKRGDRIELKISSSSLPSAVKSLSATSTTNNNNNNSNNNNNNNNNNATDTAKVTSDHRTTTQPQPPKPPVAVVVTLLYHRPKQWKKPFCVKLNKTHYDKLKSLFLRVHSQQCHPRHAIQNFSSSPTTAAKAGDDDHHDEPDASSPDDSAMASLFHLLLMTLLLRYSSLSGGHLLQDLRGGGMQGAVHEEVFHVLATATAAGPNVTDNNNNYKNNNVVNNNVILEGFASPFNCCWPAFGSVFVHDLDWHFGAIGNFLDLPFANHAAATAAAATATSSSNGNDKPQQQQQHTIVQANPPFTPGVMSYMSEHILQQVTLADERDVALTFVVVCATPGDPSDPNLAVAKRYGGDAVRPLLLLLADDDATISSYHIVLSAQEHGYVEGAQHLRPTRYKESSYDTSVIIVTSRQARTMLDMESLEQQLRVAFASRHRDETAARRRNKTINQ
jgi:Phosphorylated CTD interacting factor 1 WW domain